MFEFIPTPISGCFEIQPRTFSDHRGKFVKLFHSEIYRERGLVSSFEEVYYSVSSLNVIRGLHFQAPPDAHVKLVSCIKGKILDVVVDLRKDSPTYHRLHATELSETKGNLLYVPEGLAHGFLSLTENTLFISMNSKEFSPQSDRGVNFASIGFEWPVDSPVVSEKDRQMISLADYDSPF